MTRNPYSPPAANVEMAISQPLGPRPISAWLLLIAIALYGFVFASGTAEFLFLIASRLDQISNPWGVLLAVGWRLFIVGVFLASFVGIFKRKQWGRWLGLLMLAGFAVFSIFGQDTANYADEAQRAGGYFGRKILLPLLFAGWAYAFGFSAKAKRYFARR